MAKQSEGFTLMELMVVLAITCLGLALGLPGLSNLLQTQRLKYDVSRFKSIVENTRELSSRSECDSELRLNNSQTPTVRVLVDVQIIRNGSGPCNTWFSSAGVNSYNNQFEISGTQVDTSNQAYTFTGGGSVVSVGLNQTVKFKRGGGSASLQVRPEGFSETTYTHE
ncbi:MAG: prepilin-type N-terminal cleavage/methylation domain-containing protein [Limnobacter sp.]|nr:prepilin-type N-terminal cleavage/methylation domain-containing protein [Limnobacter sp.]